MMQKNQNQIQISNHNYVASIPARMSEHEVLDVFVGNWKPEGVLQSNPASPLMVMKVLESFRWLAGSFFMGQGEDVYSATESFKTIKVIGYDDTDNTYFIHHFDSTGYKRVYKATVKDSVWAISGQTERAIFTFADDGLSFTAFWEQNIDGVWEFLCEFGGIKAGLIH